MIQFDEHIPRTTSFKDPGGFKRRGGQYTMSLLRCKKCHGQNFKEVPPKSQTYQLRTLINWNSLAILRFRDLFGMVKTWPFQRLSDEKVTLNHLVCAFFLKLGVNCFLFSCSPYKDKDVEQFLLLFLVEKQVVAQLSSTSSTPPWRMPWDWKIFALGSPREHVGPWTCPWWRRGHRRPIAKRWKKHRCDGCCANAARPWDAWFFTWMFRWKLGFMVGKLGIIRYNLLINGVYCGYNPLILTIDPNFQQDIQVPPDWEFRHMWSWNPKGWKSPARIQTQVEES